MTRHPNDDWDELFSQLPVDTTANDKHRERLRTQFLTACENGPVPSSRRSRLRDTGRFLMKYKAPHWTVATLLVTSVFWLIQTGPSPALALDEVVAKMTKARTARYDGVVKATGQLPTKTKAYYLQPGHFRQEIGNELVSITDYTTRKMVTLDLLNKQATVINAVGKHADPNGQQQNEFERLRDQLREAVSDPETRVESLGERQLDGQTVVVFRVPNNPQVMTVWADPETRFPIRIDSVMDGPPRVELVMTNYEFNMELDRSLFSTEVPDGYSVLEFDIDMSKPNEKDFIEALRICGEETGGFLKGVDPVAAAAFSGAYLVKRGIGKDKQPTPEQMQETVKVTRGFQFTTQLPPEADAHYAGAEAKYGDKEQVVFWYRPEKSKAYRIIYADLSVKESDVAPDVENAKKLAK